MPRIGRALVVQEFGLFLCEMSQCAPCLPAGRCDSKEPSLFSIFRYAPSVLRSGISAGGWMLYALCLYSQGRVGGEIQSRRFAALSNRFHGNASSSEKRPVI